MTNEEKILDLLSAMNNRMGNIETNVAGLKTDVTGLKTDVAGLKTDVADLKTDVAGLKTDVTGLKTDVAGLKTDVAGLQTDVTGLKSDVAEVRMDIENRIDPQLQALSEGQKTILETLAPKNRVEALEEEVSFMKRVVNSLAREVDDLKRAN